MKSSKRPKMDGFTFACVGVLTVHILAAICLTKLVAVWIQLSL